MTPLSFSSTSAQQVFRGFAVQEGDGGQERDVGGAGRLAVLRMTALLEPAGTCHNFHSLCACRFIRRGQMKLEETRERRRTDETLCPFMRVLWSMRLRTNSKTETTRYASAQGPRERGNGLPTNVGKQFLARRSGLDPVVGPPE